MKNWLIILLVIAILAMGSFREVIFVSINNQIAYESGSIESNFLVSYLSFLENYSSRTLIILKWALTMLFTLSFWLLGYWALKKVFKRRMAAHYYTGLYIIFFGLAGLIYLLGALFNLEATAYDLSRGIMGGLQSPLPLIIILPALLLKKSS